MLIKSQIQLPESEGPLECGRLMLCLWREFPKYCWQCSSSYRSHLLLFTSVLLQLTFSFILELCPSGLQNRKNHSQQTSTKRKIEKMYLIATSILFFSLFKFPFCYCFVHETLFVVNFFFRSLRTVWERLRDKFREFFFLPRSFWWRDIFSQEQPKVRYEVTQNTLPQPTYQTNTIFGDASPSAK